MNNAKLNNLLIGCANTSLTPTSFNNKLHSLLDDEFNNVKITQSDAFSVSTTNGWTAISNKKTHACIVGKPHWANKALVQVANEQSHADALIKAYKDYGTNLFKYLSGRFSFALHDSESDKLIIALDKIGQQHLFYSNIGDGIIFGSSANLIKMISGHDYDINPQSIFDYFYFHSVPSPQSIYKNIHKLVGGHYLSFHKGQCEVTQYWQPEFNEAPPSSLADLKAEMLEIVSNSVSQYTDGNNVGAFLSGGLDSSTVAGMLAKNSASQAKTFSIGFNVAGYDETGFARIASKHFDTNHHEYYVTPEDVVSMVPNIAESYDEPFGNSSALPAYFCAKLAKENGISLMLGGDGGDEIFAGNERYAKQNVFELYQKTPNIIRQLLLEPILLGLPGVNNIPLLKKAHSYVSQAKMPLPDRMEAYNFLQRLDVKTMFTDEFLTNADIHEPINLLRETYNSPQNATSLNRMMYLDWKRTLQDNDLVKVNRMCELAGVDVGFPLLSDELIEFSCKIPSDIKLKGQNLRWFFKQSVKGFLPDEIINKSKHGFGLPFGIWTESHPELKALAYDSVNNFKTREIIRPEFIDKVIRMHQSEHAAYYGELVWIIMMLELWMASH